MVILIRILSICSICSVDVYVSVIFRIDGSLFTENSYQGRVAVQNYTGHARIDNFLADVCKLVNPFNKLPMVTRD